MRDMSKCTGENCPVKEKCWRYKYPSKHNHQYFFSPPSEKNCQFFMPIHSETQKFIDGDKNGLF